MLKSLEELNLHSLHSFSCFTWEERIVGGKIQGAGAKTRVLYLKLRRFQTFSLPYFFPLISRSKILAIFSGQALDFSVTK